MPTFRFPKNFRTLYRVRKGQVDHQGNRIMCTELVIHESDPVRMPVKKGEPIDEEIISEWFSWFTEILASHTPSFNRVLNGHSSELESITLQADCLVGNGEEEDGTSLFSARFSAVGEKHIQAVIVHRPSVRCYCPVCVGDIQDLTGSVNEKPVENKLSLVSDADDVWLPPELFQRSDIIHEITHPSKVRRDWVIHRLTQGAFQTSRNKDVQLSYHCYTSFDGTHRFTVVETRLQGRAFRVLVIPFDNNLPILLSHDEQCSVLCEFCQLSKD